MRIGIPSFDMMFRVKLATGSLRYYPIETPEEYEAFLKEIKWKKLRG